MGRDIIASMLSMDSKLEAAVGAKSAKALAGALDLHTVGDLVRYFPRRYAERGELTDIAGLEIGEHVTVMARVQSYNERRMRQRSGWISEVVITDGSRTLECTFFNQRHHKRRRSCAPVAGSTTTTTPFARSTPPPTGRACRSPGSA